MNFATIEAASLISIANTNIESTFKSIKKARHISGMPEASETHIRCQMESL
nr:MAG TPA: hypothetical protein [Caudoviricetes sp.]